MEVFQPDERARLLSTLERQLRPFLQEEEPWCPKHCDVATPPERQSDGRYVCTACGHSFPWPPAA